MKRENDRIIFESRSEVSYIQSVLDEYRTEHKKDVRRSAYARELSDLLDVMFMEW